MRTTTFVGRDRLTFTCSAAEEVRTILANRRYSVNFFGAPCPKFKTHEAMKVWCEAQAEAYHNYIEQLGKLRRIAIDCMATTIAAEQCDCDALLADQPTAAVGSTVN